jgi:methionine-rich copper-binding protein CopC
MWRKILPILIGLGVIVFAIMWRQAPERVVDEIRPITLVDSVPAHGDLFAEQPYQITITADADIVDGSEITVVRRYGSKQGHTVVVGAGGMIDESRRTLRAPIPDRLADGRYTMLYRLCHATGCHDGRLQFVLDRINVVAFTDLRGQPEPTIHIEAEQFTKQYIIVDSGAAVTWVNDDTQKHTINLPDFNSAELNPGESYSFVFTEPGQFSYHDATRPTMTGAVIVRPR